MSTFTTIDEYIATFDSGIQVLLGQMRTTIAREAPMASERISYGLPTFHWKKNLVHFAAFKEHIGFYPTGSGIEHFLPRLGAWKTSRGAIRFPFGKPLPLELVAEITRFRVNEIRNS